MGLAEAPRQRHHFSPLTNPAVLTPSQEPWEDHALEPRCMQICSSKGIPEDLDFRLKTNLNVYQVNGENKKFL